MVSVLDGFEDKVVASMYLLVGRNPETETWCFGLLIKNLGRMRHQIWISPNHIEKSGYTVLSPVLTPGIGVIKDVGSMVFGFRTPEIGEKPGLPKRKRGDLVRSPRNDSTLAEQGN